MTPLENFAARWRLPPAAYEELMTLVTRQDFVRFRQVDGGLSELAVQQQLRVTAPQMGIALWRNNNGACKDDTGRQIRYGLGNDSQRLNKKWKSSDLIGIGPGGRFMAVEVKHPGWRAPSNERERAQAAFIGTVNSMGGIGGFATSVEDLKRMVTP